MNINQENKFIKFLWCKPFGHNYKHITTVFDLQKTQKNEFDYFKEMIKCKYCGDLRMINRGKKYPN